MAIEDRYEVKASMGEGGFSRVYRGEERSTGRAVALKVLKSAFYENAEVRERFQREVFAVASLSNPHIVGMYDFDLNCKDLYIAMEYVAGHTLRERMRHDFTLAQRFAILAQIADAIDAAHERNVLHRDLKPENIKIVQQDSGAIEVKVLDFGMAKLTELESRLELEPLTRAGICFGTPQYMSPEQIRGKLDDKSIDLYALAIIAYEFLSGRRPWDGGDPYEIMRAVLRIPAPTINCLMVGRDEEPLSAARMGAVNAFFSGALAKRLAERPTSARALVAGLEEALFGRAGAPQAALMSEPTHIRRSDDTVPVASMYASGSLPGIALSPASMSDTDRTAMAPEVLARALEDHAQARVAAGALHVQTGDLADASVPVVVELIAELPSGRVEITPAVREEAARAMVALQATRRSERSYRGFLVPLLVIAALGSSVGYLLAGSASAQSSEVHDFIVGK